MIALALASLSLTACAVAPENYERNISMNWNLAPASSEVSRRTVEAGDVIISWTAQAKATHVMDSASGPIPLVMARTTYGQLYCGSKACYEDRNADGAFDYEWQLGRNGAPPNEPRAANNPKELKKQIAFRATEMPGNPVFQQVLGLVYTGPLEGVPKEDQTLLPMIGELSLGWYGGAGSARTPDGVGWSLEQRIPMILADEDHGQSTRPNLQGRARNDRRHARTRIPGEACREHRSRRQAEVRRREGSRPGRKTCTAAALILSSLRNPTGPHTCGSQHRRPVE
jgi:hypothetical protein